MDNFILILALAGFSLGLGLIIYGVVANRGLLPVLGLFPLFLASAWGQGSYRMAQEITPTQYRDVASITDPIHKKIILSKMKEGRLTHGALQEAMDEYDRLEVKAARQKFVSWAKN